MEEKQVSFKFRLDQEDVMMDKSLHYFIIHLLHFFSFLQLLSFILFAFILLFFSFSIFFIQVPCLLKDLLEQFLSFQFWEHFCISFLYRVYLVYQYKTQNLFICKVQRQLSMNTNMIFAILNQYTEIFLKYILHSYFIFP